MRYDEVSNKRIATLHHGKLDKHHDIVKSRLISCFIFTLHEQNIYFVQQEENLAGRNFKVRNLLIPRTYILQTSVVHIRVQRELATVF